MASILDRVSTLISANINYLISQAMKANSIAIVDQYIRNVETNLEALEDAAATVGGEAKTLRRKYNEYQGQVNELDRNIDIFLREGKEPLAVAAQSRYNTVKRLADQYGEQAAAQEAEYQKLLDAKLKLEAKLTEVRQERVELQAMLELAKSKELTHQAVEGVAGVTEAEAGIDDMREAIRKRLDKAQAQADMDAGRLENQMAEVLEEHTISVQLEERKRKMGLAQG
jgi:phage shock protein A